MQRYKELYRKWPHHLKNILLDTGSAGTILDADIVTGIGVNPEGMDQTAVIHGIGS